MSPYSYEIGYKTLITIFKVLQPLNNDLREVIADIIFDKLIMEDLFHDYETIVSLDDDNWEYDIEGTLEYTPKIFDKRDYIPYKDSNYESIEKMFITVIKDYILSKIISKVYIKYWSYMDKKYIYDGRITKIL